MKKYEYTEADYCSMFFQGNATEIKSLYKALLRRYEEGVFSPAHLSFPELVSGRTYLLEIQEDGTYTVSRDYLDTLSGFSDCFEGCSLTFLSDLGDCSPSRKGRVTIDE